MFPIGDNDISCLTETATGAAPLPDQLKINFENRFGVHIHNGYGMTESSLMLTRSAFDFPPPLGSVGLPIPYASVITAEVKGNRLIRECGTNETGVILARGPSCFQGDLSPADDADAWVDKHWFNTGDLGYKDEQGYLFLTGRSRDLIIRGGHNIDPAIIEEPLTQHPAIAQVVAIGQPDPYAGEIPIAYVTLISGQSVDPDELLLYCQKMIGEPAAVPKRVEVITERPLTAVAKIYKPALRQRAAEFALTTSLSAAGIEASVTAWIDLQRGLLARIELDCAEQQSQAEAVLQNYPLIIEFE